MCFCLGRVRVSVRELKCHPRIIIVSTNPRSAFKLFLRHHGLPGDRFVDVLWLSCYFDSKGDCRFKSVGIACPGEINGESSCVVDVDICLGAGIDWDIDNQFPSHCKRYIVV
jgi:hypothetical protein